MTTNPGTFVYTLSQASVVQKYFLYLALMWLGRNINKKRVGATLNACNLKVSFGKVDCDYCARGRGWW